MDKESDPLIKLAALELNIDLKSISTNDCPTLCEQLYNYAGQDGHNIMNATNSTCVCKPIQTTPATQKM